MNRSTNHTTLQRFWYFDPRNPVVFTTNEMHSNIIVIVLTNNTVVSVHVSQWLSFFHWNQWLRFISCLFPETTNDDAGLVVATNDSACRYCMFLKSEIGITQGDRRTVRGRGVVLMILEYCFRFNTTVRINLGIFDVILVLGFFILLF